MINNVAYINVVCINTTRKRKLVKNDECFIICRLVVQLFRGVPRSIVIGEGLGGGNLKKSL